jgi:16S rRNA (cytosine967-C5)-methyltransferase
LAKPIPVRVAATQILLQVVEQHQSVNKVFAELLPKVKENDRGLCQQLCYGVLRWHTTLEALAQQLLSKGLKQKDADIKLLLLIGLYQLRSMRIKPHAALSETVAATGVLGKSWAKGLINACLRNYQRGHDDFEANLDKTAVSAHPEWLLDAIKQDWPEQWPAIIDANNAQAPMMLRVNQQQSQREDYLQQLHDADITATALEGCDSAVILDKPCDVFLLPNFDSGMASVQDGSAQLASTIMPLSPGQRVLDACAAPGGKTGHLLELQPDINLLAVDIDPQRLGSIQQNLDRIGLEATLKAADAGDINSWWDGEGFDRILLDAPCSGSGVIRRHPDIKVLRQAEDIAVLARRQQQLLDNLWATLNPSGIMVYTTCSIFRVENELQIGDFLQRHKDAVEVKLDPAPAREVSHGYQRLPGEDRMDGFYYACLRKA